MIKQLILGLYKPEKNKTIQHHSYDSAQSFGIISDDDHISSESLEEIVNWLKADGKTVHLIKYSQASDEDRFSNKDISVFGKIKHPQVFNFISKKFDFLLCLTLRLDASIAFLIKKSKTDYRVGLIESPSLFHLTIRPSDKQNFQKELMKYLKMIRHE